MKEEKIKKGIKIGIFLLLGILLISVGSAAYIRSSSVQYTQPGSGFSSGGYWQPDRSICEAGQDFIIQIVPFGCEPAVVRTDLLEEQNVPVFCQLGATKINPLIDVEAIESISFTGKRPKEVSGIGFHPARAALGISGNLNSPILNNIGYVVIVLKKQENASAMPDFVQGNLTAKIKYDIKNAFGIGKASFYLPEMSDEDWEKKHPQYNFWNGRFYLRAEGIDEEGARILVYDDTRRISSVSLEKGETSHMIYLPGFDCLAGLKLKLNGLEAPDTRAKLDINGEIVEVAEDEKFLENRCWITNIDKKGLVQKVTIRCKEDEDSGFFGSESFELMISPKVNLTIYNEDGSLFKEGEFSVGDELYKEETSKRKVFLGYIGKRIKDTCKFVREDRTKIDMGLLSIEKEEVVTYGRRAVTRFPKKLFDNPRKGKIGKIKFKIGSNELLRLWGSFSKIKKDREYSKKISVNENMVRKISRELRKKEIKSENFYKYLDKKVLNKK